MSAGVLLTDVEVGGVVVDVHISGMVIVEIGSGLRPEGDATVVAGHGGAVLPGLHDHHIHLMAAAAAGQSVAAGPPEVRDRAGLQRALGEADARLPAGSWLRAIGYHEQVAGDLDRHDLDSLLATRPVRVQHRSGARWTLNGRAVELLRLEALSHPGIERDAQGHVTGRVHRSDAWLRALLPAAEPPDLGGLATLLASRGVTGLTDATPFARAEDLAPLAQAVGTGMVPQRLVVTGGPELSEAKPPAGLELGPVKLIIDDASYPDPDGLAADVARAHACARPVAVHCVTRTAIVLALVAWDKVGARAGDRVEHGSVLPPELAARLASHGITVVTQPGFVAERGDAYLRDVEPEDRAHLYPCRSLLAAGVAVAGSTDAPYSAPDPWRAMRAAVDRTTLQGLVLGDAERVTPRQALALFLGDAHDPGGAPRAVAVGQRADLCLLHTPLAPALRRLTADDVAATICAGRVVYTA